MSLYSIALFLHVLVAVSLFTTSGIVFACLIQLRKAKTVDQVRTWIRLPNVAGRLVPLLELLMLASGAYLFAMAWWSIQPAWAIVALATLVVLLPFGLATIGRPLQRLFTTVQEMSDGPLPERLQAEVRSPVLWTSHWVFITLLIGILFLMTTKPDLWGSLTAIGLALLLGIIAGFPFRRARQTQMADKGSVDAASSKGVSHE